MGKILITGRGGTGKTTIHELLLAKGYNSFDADEIPGLARWEDKNDKPVDVDYTGFVDYSKVSWNWNKAALERSLNQAEKVIICGSSSNQMGFYDLFDKVIILAMDEISHRQRLQNRKSEYGKEEKTMRWLLDAHQKLAAESKELGAILIDASGTPQETVTQIERYLQ
jgi:dephospho-CoA kinase